MTNPNPQLPNAAEETEDWSFPVLAELDEAIENEMLGSHVCQGWQPV